MTTADRAARYETLNHCAQMIQQQIAEAEEKGHAAVVCQLLDRQAVIVKMRDEVFPELTETPET